MTDTETLLVAGVGETIGTAVARRFAEAGWDVALLARSPEHIERLADELRATHDVETLAVRADVTDGPALESATDRIREELGRVRCLVCNASAGGGHPVEEADIETLERLWRVRTLGSFRLVRACLDDLRATSGTVVVSGTTYATDPAPEQLEWGSAAPATRGLARSLDAGLDTVDVCYVHIGSAVRPPASSFPGALAAETVAERYLELTRAEKPPRDVRLEAD